jgi:hypothetical protein
VDEVPRQEQRSSLLVLALAVPAAAVIAINNWAVKVVMRVRATYNLVWLSLYLRPFD